MINHKSDCATNNAPAEEPGACDCGALSAPDEALRKREHQDSRMLYAVRVRGSTKTPGVGLTSWNDTFEGHVSLPTNEAVDYAREFQEVSYKAVEISGFASVAEVEVKYVGLVRDAAWGHHE